MGSNKVDFNFWKNKRVLLTGHTGFKGSWLSLWLQSMGAILRGISLPPLAFPNLFDIANVALKMEHRIVDIRNYDDVKFQMDEFKPEIVIHMAAQPLVRLSYTQPIETYFTNVMGTVHVLEAARHCSSIKVILNVTTDKCYENQEWLWGYRENDILGGFDPYSNSKACSELITSSYKKSFLENKNIAIATARSGNVIGGGDWAKDRLVPDILRSLQNNQPILIRNPLSVRPWLHVLEPLSGYLLLVQCLYESSTKYSEAWNFGPLDEDLKTVKWIVENLCNKWGNNAKWELHDDEHPKETNYLKLDISKSKNRLGWVPKYSIDKSINLVLEWYKAYLDGKKMQSFCINQIHEYGL